MTTHPQKVRARRKRLTAKQRSEIASAFSQGAGTKELSERYGVTTQTILNIARREKAERKTARIDTKMVSARVPVQDVDAFDAALTRLGVDQKSVVLRAFVRYPAGFLFPDEGTAEAIHELRRELSAIGSNLNQIARRLNDPRLRPTERAVNRHEQEVLHELRVALNRANESLSIMSGQWARKGDQAFKNIVREARDGKDS